MLDRRRRAAARICPLAVLTSATLLLAACGSGASAGDGPSGSSPAFPRTPVASAAPPSSSAAPEASIPAHESPGRATSDRGLPLYAPGETVELEGAGGNPAINLTVTSVSVAGTCPVDGGKPVNGAFALLEVEASFDKATDPDAQQRPLVLAPTAWSYYPVDGPRYDGDLDTTAAASCQQAGNALPAELKPGGSVRGTLVLDIPQAGGALTLADAGTDVAEWHLP